MKHDLHKLINSLDILPAREESKSYGKVEKYGEAMKKFRRDLKKRGIDYKKVVPNAKKRIKIFS